MPHASPLPRALRLLPLAALLAFAACAGGEEAAPGEAEAAPAPATRVETLTLQPTTFDEVIELTGTVEAVSDATLSAQASGTVTSLRGLGTFLAAGQAVAQVDARLAQAGTAQAEAAVASAQAQLALAEDSFQRQQPLFRDSIISALEFEGVRAQRAQAQAGLAQARAGLAQAQKQLQNTIVAAPFGGYVEEHFVELGEQIAPGQPVARVVGSGRVKIVVGVPERYAGSIVRGTPVSIRFSAYDVSPREGVVTFASNVINAQNRTFRVEVELGNPGGDLKPQMVAKVLVTRRQLRDVIVAPQLAILRDENGQTAYVAEPASGSPTGYTARLRDVALGASSDGRVVVEQGLGAGDRLIVLGQTTITEGDPVEIAEAAGGAVIAGDSAD